MTIYTGTTAAIYLCNAATASTVAFDESAFVDVSGTDRKRFAMPTTARAAKRFWDSTATTDVYIGAAKQNSGYTVQYMGGYVKFNPAAAAGAIRVTGKYFPVTQVATATEWQLQVQRSLADATVLGSDGWKQSFPMERAGQITFSQLLQTGNDYEDFVGQTAAYTDLGVTLLVVLWVTYNSTNGTGKGYACFAKANQTSLSSSLSALERQQLSLEAYGKVYYINDDSSAVVP